MGFTNFPNGVTSFGIPIMGGDYSIPNANGKVLFVDPNGLAPRSSSGRAFRTIQDAIDSMATDSGSTILVFPGSYDENLVVSGINYLTIAGAMLPGYSKPDIVPSAGIALYVQASQGIVLRHLRLVSEDDDVILQEGNGFIIAGCVIDGNLPAAAKCGIRLKGNATDDAFTASEGKIYGNYFRSNDIGIGFDTAEAAVGVGSTDNEIFGNVFSRNTLDLATLDTGPGTYSVQFTNIYNNQFVDKNKATYIDFTTSNGGAAGDQSGSVNGNYFASDTMTTTVIKAVGTAFTFSGNYDTVGIFDGSGLD